MSYIRHSPEYVAFCCWMRHTLTRHAEIRVVHLRTALFTHTWIQTIVFRPRLFIRNVSRARLVSAANFRLQLSEAIIRSDLWVGTTFVPTFVRRSRCRVKFGSRRQTSRVLSSHKMTTFWQHVRKFRVSHGVGNISKSGATISLDWDCEGWATHK
jgi:hypothetical protein